MARRTSPTPSPNVTFRTFSTPSATRPILVLQGAKDEIVPWTQASFLHEELNARGRMQDTVAIYPTGGHGFLFWDDPELHGQAELADAEEAREKMSEFLQLQAGIATR